MTRFALFRVGAAAVVVAALAALYSCDVPAAPALQIEQTALGEYNAMPLFTWSAAGQTHIKLASYAIDQSESWTPLAPSVTSFRPDEPLAAGEHTVYLRLDTRGGLSEIASLQFTVTELPTWEPDDTYYDLPNPEDIEQWALSQIEMPLAWGALTEVFTEREEVIVAVIDTGYTEHPDLLENLLTDQGYDFISEASIANDGDGIDPDATDAGDAVEYGNSWHGTSVAGTIASVTDNASGTAGMAIDKVSIMPLRALGKGGGYTYDIGQAVRYAARLTNDSGTLPTTAAQVINMSLGSLAPELRQGIVFDLAITDDLTEAAAAGVISVAASGNGSNDPSWVSVGSPANLPTVIAVGATAETRAISYYSQMGAEIDVVAPGGDYTVDDTVLLPSAYPYAEQPLVTGDYEFAGLQGTSFACPHVAGAIALMLTIPDVSLDLNSARSLLKHSASDLEPPVMVGGFEIGILSVAGMIETYFGGRFAYGGDRPQFSVAHPDARSLGRPGGGSYEMLSAQTLTDPGYVDQARLIVKFSDVQAADLLQQSAPRGVAAVSGTNNRTRLIHLEPDAGISEMREQLLAEPGVEAVYYNFRYVPL